MDQITVYLLVKSKFTLRGYHIELQGFVYILRISSVWIFF